MADKSKGREDRPASQRLGFAGKTAPDTGRDQPVTEVTKSEPGSPPITKGTDPKLNPVPQSLPANEPLAPPAVTAAVQEEAKKSSDLRTRTLAQDTHAESPQKVEGEYRDPDSVGPNPDVEAYPGQKPNIDRQFNNPALRPLPSNMHRVYPEHAFGTTPTDPDIRERDEQPTNEQAEEMVRRRHVTDRTAMTTEEHLPLKEFKSERLSRRLEEHKNAVPESAKPQPEAPVGELESLETDQTYRLNPEGKTFPWWRNKYNSNDVRIVITGDIKDTFGYEYGARELYGHYLFTQYNDRRNSVPKGHPIRKHDDRIYVGMVGGRRELVHVSEVEAVEEE